MTTKNNSRSWRSDWTSERGSRISVHKSGVTARVSPSTTDPTKDRITLENTDTIDPAHWDIGEITEQAIKLWMEGEF